LIDRRRHDVRSFRPADCKSDHYLVAEKFTNGLAVNKQRSHKLGMERFNFKELNKVHGKEQYHVEVSKWFGAFSFE
jgi:hypothetical protein